VKFEQDIDKRQAGCQPFGQSELKSPQSLVSAAQGALGSQVLQQTEQQGSEHKTMSCFVGVLRGC
jgi:hypothetical protein